MRVPGRPPVFLDIVEEHFDELDFLWELREANVFTPDWDLAYLAYHEERAEAHLDGLRLAELHAIDLATERLSSGEMSAALASTLVLCASESGAHLEPVRKALRTGEPPVVDGIRRALRHGCPADLRPTLRELGTSKEPVRAAAAMDVLAFLGEPITGVERLLGSESAAVRCLAFGAAARAKSLTEASVQVGLEHPEPTVRSSAMRAGAWMGWPGLLPACRSNALRPTDPDPAAIAMLGSLGDPADEPRLRSALERPELAAGAVQALGALGLVTSVPLLLELMKDPKLGIPAAKAYRRITGSERSFGEKPFPPPPVAEGEDESEELPPDPEGAAADWQRRASSLSRDTAWQIGHAVPFQALPPDFDRLPLDSRRDVYLRLRARRLSVPDLELEALALRQRR